MPSLVPATFLIPVEGKSRAPAAGLTKIDRTIAKEPAYKSKPKYCLLVFGPEAKTRVWLVLDGDTLYVDRNGNGDLTEKGERFVLALDEYDLKRGKRVWHVGDIEAPGNHVAHQAVRYVLPMGLGAALQADQGTGVPLHPPFEFEQQPALAHPDIADDGNDRQFALAKRPFEGIY